MKLCPQCDFIYEDEQSVCDMDGNELVYDPMRLPFATESASLLAKPQLRSFAVAAVAGIILAMVLSAAYYALAGHWRSGSSNQSKARAAGLQLPAPDSVSVPVASLAETPSPERSSSPNLTSLTPLPQSPPPPKSFAPARFASSPVSTTSSNETRRAPVMIRLTNGAAIKADEAWERREGIWYRQSGMVAFLKRRRVRAIERIVSSLQRPQPTVSKSEEKRKPENTLARIRKA